MSISKRELLLESLGNSQRIMKKLFYPCGCSHGETITILVISKLLKKCNAHETGVKSQEISNHTGFSKPHLSQFLNALEEKELIYRTISKNDRRVIFVNLTLLGKQLVDEIQAVHEVFFNQVIESMSEEKIDEMISLLIQFHTIMKEHLNLIPTDLSAVGEKIIKNKESNRD